MVIAMSLRYQYSNMQFPVCSIAAGDNHFLT